MMRRLALSALVICASVSHAVTYYSMTDLGTMGGQFSFHNNGRGNSVSTGMFDSGSGNHAFMYDGAISHDLGTLGGAWSVGYGVLGGGQTVGQSENGSGAFHAFYHDTVTMQDLSFLGANSAAYGVNNAIHIVGQHSVLGQTVGFISTTTALISDLGFMESMDVATAVNSVSHVAGYGMTSGVNHAWFYDTSLHDLGALIPGGFSNARGISNNDYVTGMAESTTGYTGFFWDGFTMSALNPLSGDNYSDSNSVNNFGTCVGYSYGSSQRGMVWEGGVGYDLNSLLIGSSYGLSIRDGRSITGNGLIFANAADSNGNLHAVILNPTTTPEPASVLGISAGFAALLRRRRRKA